MYSAATVVQDRLFLFAQNDDTLCHYESQTERGELGLLEEKNSLMLIALVVVFVFSKVKVN